MKVLCKSVRMLFLVSLTWVIPFQANGADELNGIIAGNWVQVRGHMDEHGSFLAERVELIDPQSKELLIGTVSTPSISGEFLLLGQAVQISQKTRFTNVTASKLFNERVKVEGHYRGPNRFSARAIRARGPGRERIEGLVSNIRRIDNGYLLTIMKHEIRVPDGVKLRHEKPISEYAVVSLNIGLPPGRQLSEDDQFGNGIRINNRIRFSTLIETRYKGEDNYDLDNRRNRDLEESAASIRGRLVLSPGNHGISGQVEVRQ